MAKHTHTLLKVSIHPSGRHTLMEKTPKERMYQDLKGPLLANLHPVKFYRAVAVYLAKLAAAGVLFCYEDSPLGKSN